MKNPLVYLKHVIKDPITTIEEADIRKKELMPLLYTSIGIAAVGGIGSMFLNFLTALTVIGALGIALCLFLFFIIKRAKAKFAALTCDGCKKMMEIKTKEEYDKYVTYSIGGFSHAINFSQVADANKTGIEKISVLGSTSASIIYECTCPHCGTKNRIQYIVSPLKTEVGEAYKPAIFKPEVIESETESLVVSTLRALASHSAQYGALPAELVNKKIIAKKGLTANMLTFTLTDEEVKQIRESLVTQLSITSHSIHHADYGKASIASASCPADGKFRSVGLKYHRTIDEMAEGFFVRNELNGDISKI